MIPPHNDCLPTASWSRRHSSGWCQSCPSLHQLLPQSLLTWTITKSSTVFPASCLTFLSATSPASRVILPTVGTIQSTSTPGSSSVGSLPVVMTQNLPIYLSLFLPHLLPLSPGTPYCQQVCSCLSLNTWCTLTPASLLPACTSPTPIRMYSSQ